MGDTRHVSGVVTQFVLGCDLTAFYFLMTLRDGPLEGFFPQALMLFAPLVYGVNRLFLRREPTLRGGVFLNLLLAGAFLGACLCLDGWGGIAQGVFTALFTAWVVGSGGWLSLRPVGLREALLYLDASVLTLVIFAAYTAATGTALVWSAPALCGFAAALVGVSVCRAGDRIRGRTLAGLAAAFGVVFLVMWLLVSVVAAPAGEGIVTLWGVLTGGVRAVLNGAYRLLLAIAALFPDPETSTGEPLWDASGNWNLEQQGQEEGNPILALVFVVRQLALLVGLAVWVLAQMGKIKLGSRSVKAAAPQQRRTRPSLRRGLRTLFVSWVEFAQLRVFLWKNRGTPMGVYFLLVHRCRMSPWHKRPGETPREFILRLAKSAQDQPELARALEELAASVDLQLYGRCPEGARVEQAGRIIRQIGASLRRNFVRERAAKWSPPSPASDQAP